jgi:RNA polymerase sigma-70 factor, ECF subfamily
MPPNKFSIYSDEELMHFICKGEVVAFDELYNRYGKRLLLYFTRMLNYDKEQAEDALQELFLKIAETPEKFDRSRSFKTWVFSVASNACKNYYRHHLVVKQNIEDAMYDQQNQNYFALESAIVKLDKQKFEYALENALLGLAPEKKEAFILRYQEEKSIAEIAQIQDCPEGSVKSRIHYTLKLLEEKLKLYNPVNY